MSSSSSSSSSNPNEVVSEGTGICATNNMEEQASDPDLDPEEAATSTVDTTGTTTGGDGSTGGTSSNGAEEDCDCDSKKSILIAQAQGFLLVEEGQAEATQVEEVTDVDVDVTSSTCIDTCTGTGTGTAKGMHVSSAEALTELNVSQMILQAQRSVQPLPAVSSTTGAPYWRDVGAFSIQTPRLATLATATMDTTTGMSGSSPVPPPPPSVSSLGTDRSLIEAQLVAATNDTDVMIVIAEEIDVRSTHTDASTVAANTKRRNMLQGTAAIVIILLLLAIVIMLVLQQQQQKQNQPKQPNNNKEDSRCFQSTQDLLDAVDAYLLDGSPTANVSLQYGWPMGTWCVTHIRRFAHVFQTSRTRGPQYFTRNDQLTQAAEQFAPDLSDWDMSQAHDVEEMLRGVQNMSSAWGIQNWDTSNMLSLRALFLDTHWPTDNDPPNLSAWDVSNVQTLNQLVRWSNIPHANMSHWDTGNVVDMGHFAEGAPLFNEDLSAWDMSSAVNFLKIFWKASSFDQDISTWNVQSVTNMELAFGAAVRFNQPIGVWDVSNVTSMYSIFQGATALDQDLAQWNVSRVSDLRYAFQGASSFAQDLCAWGERLPPTVNVTGMFQGTACPNTSDPVLEDGGPFCFNCHDHGA